jgi:hypothetical protein
MSKPLTAMVIGIPLLTAITLFSYQLFQGYEPKVLRQLEEVRGIKDEREVLIPYPRGSRKVGINKTSEGEEITFQTRLTLTQVRDFYENIFQGKGWKVESENVEETFVVTEFKNEHSVVSLQATAQPEFGMSVVTLGISK